MGQSTLHVHFDFGMCDTAIEVQGHLITQKILINNNEMAKPRRYDTQLAVIRCQFHICTNSVFALKTTRLRERGNKFYLTSPEARTIGTETSGKLCATEGPGRERHLGAKKGKPEQSPHLLNFQLDSEV